jgi:hypothetical protein
MREHYHDVLAREDFSAFPLTYYVSAFVSAARSVAWILRSEYHSVDGWSEWYRSQTLTEEQARTLAAFTAIRNRSQKAEPLILGVRLQSEKPSGEPEATEYLPLPKRRQIRMVPIEANGTEGTPIVLPLERLEMELPELGEADVYVSAKAYLQLLEDLLDRCEAEFGPPTP